MTHELEMSGKKAVVAYSRHCLRNLLAWLRKNMKNVDQESRFPGRESDRVSGEYNFRALQLE
jgi:hypothetical protein